MRIRTILLAAPVVVLMAFAAAYLVARPYFSHRVDQMTMMYPSEPETLNPILSTTLPAGIIESFLFDGLTDLDENLEIIPQLAERYDLAQGSRLYFSTPDDAAAGAARIREHQADWAKVKIREVSVEADTVSLRLDQAGTAYQETVFGWIAPLKTVPVRRWTGGFAKDLALQGKPVTTDTLNQWVEKNKAAASAWPRVLYVWKNTSASYEIFTVGADAAFVDDLQRRFAEFVGAKVEPVKPAVVTAEVPAKAVASGPASGPAQASASAPATVPASSAVPEGMRLNLAGPLKVRFESEWPAQDEPVITFHLRKDAIWHDGKPLTARDARFTYEALMSEQNASPRRSDFELIRRVDVPDDYTFVVTYKEPYSPCLYSWGMPLLPEHLLGDKPNLRKLEGDYNRLPVGTGPFRIAEWVTDQYIKLERFDGYWEGKAHLPAITFRVIPDTTISQMEFQTRGFDYTALDPHQVQRFKKDPQYDTHRYPSNSYAYVGWNLQRPIFKDKRVRHALAHAIDIDAVIQYVMYGNGTPCTGPYAPVTPWFNPDIKPLEYNPQKAKLLLAEAGWKDTDGDGVVDKDGQPFHFTIIIPSGNPIGQDFAVLVKDYLRVVGIGVNINIYEWTVYIEKYIDVRNFDACIMSWSLGYDQDLYQIWHSSQIQLPRSLNFISYANPEVDRLIEKSRTEFDLEKVKQYTHRIQALIYDDQPYCFLFYRMANVAIPKNSYFVKRPDPERPRQWLEEPIRPTKRGVTFYQRWWARTSPQMAPVGDAVKVIDTGN